MPSYLHESPCCLRKEEGRGGGRGSEEGRRRGWEVLHSSWKRKEEFLPPLPASRANILRYQKNKREKERKKQKRNRRNVNFYEISFVHSTSRRLDLSRLCIGRKVSCRRVDRLAASSRTRPARAVQCNSPREPGRERESTGFRSLFVKGARVRTTTFPTTVETL